MSQVYLRDKGQEKKIKNYLCVRANYDFFFRPLHSSVLTSVFIEQIVFDVFVLVQHNTVLAAS